jgi:N-terminal acetyltransferase 2
MARFPFLRLFAQSPRLAAPLLPVTRLRLTPAVRTTNQTRLFRSTRSAFSSPPPITPTTPHLPPDASLSQKLKHLIKSYGWYALGVYLVLSALDFGVAFIGVNLLGAEYVSHVATSVRQLVTGFLHSRPAEPGLDEIEPATGNPAAKGHEGLYAMLVLAYTIHKTLFLPVRVGLTAAATPRLVHWLRARGWAGSEGTKRAAHEMRERIRERRSRD